MKKLLLAMATILMTMGSCSTPQGDNQEATANTADKGQAAIENIMTRTSIRQYKDQPVEQEKIDIMLKAASMTKRLSTCWLAVSRPMHRC